MNGKIISIPLKHLNILQSFQAGKAIKEDDDSELCIELDPGMAFGTGDHPTTSMCLNAIEQYVSPKDSVIDVGTGSGILSIACHLLGVKRIKAVDLDEMAVRVAKENFEKILVKRQLKQQPVTYYMKKQVNMMLLSQIS